MTNLIMLLLAVLSVFMITDINFAGKEKINEFVDKTIEVFGKIEESLKK